MEIRILRSFLAVCREGSISEAARSLRLAQPTLTRQLQSLEEELGKRLFRRTAHGMSPTPEGIFLRKRAEELVSLADRTEIDFSVMGERIRGDVRIGGAETEAMREVVRTAKELRNECPEIRFFFHSGSAGDVIERLDAGLLDFALLLSPADLARFDGVRLPTVDVRGILMRKDSPLAKKKSVSREDLKDKPLIVSRKFLQQLQTRRNDCAAWFGSDFSKLKIAAVYNLVYSATLMVEEGIGYAFSLKGLVNVPEDGPLRFRPLRPRLTAQSWLVWKRDPVFSAAAAAFRDMIAERFPSIRKTRKER